MERPSKFHGAWRTATRGAVACGLWHREQAETCLSPVSSLPGQAAIAAARYTLLVLAALTLLPGCQRFWHDTFLPHPQPEETLGLAEIRGLGPLPFKKSIRARDGGYSARFAGRSVWTFGDTVLSVTAEDGARWRSSTWAWTRDLDPSQGLPIFSEYVDARGAPGEFLPFTEEEAAYNAEHFRQDLPEEERSRWALWPGPIAVDPATGQALVFYSKIFARSGKFNFEAEGHSIAVWEHPDKPITRPEFNPAAKDPTLLFPKEDVVLGQGALADGGWLYAYGCRTEDLSWPCIVARVKFHDALNRGAWRFYAGGSIWSKDWRKAIPIMEAAPMLSVHWNEYLKRYVALYSTPLKNTIAIRTAKHPEGPWPPVQAACDTLPPTTENVWNYAGLAHPEFSRENGRIEYLSYYRETGPLQGEVRLIEMVYE